MYSQYVAYFKGFAEKHPKLGISDNEDHFFEADVRQVLQTGLKSSKAKDPLLILEPYDLKLVRGDRSLKANAECAFMVISTLENNDARKTTAVLEECEAVAFDIISAILWDNDNQDYTHFSKQILRDSFTIQPTGKLAGNRLGWRVTFELHKDNVVSACLQNFPEYESDDN